MRQTTDWVLVRLMKWWETQPRAAQILSALWLGIICSVAFLLHLGSIGLVDETEPLFVEASRQMTVTGDWITPYFNGETRFDKPPLIYWLMALGFQTFGVNEWTARLPSALSAIALVVLGFYTLRRFGYPRPGSVSVSTASQLPPLPTISQPNYTNSDPTSPPLPPAASDIFTADPTDSPSSSSVNSTNLSLWLSAWIGAMIMALTPEIIGWARMGVSDMLLTGCIGSSLFCFFIAYAQPEHPKRQTAWYMAFYVLLGLAVLAKGPVGVVLPGLVVLAFLAIVGRLRQVLLGEMHLLWGSLIFFAIAVPWYILVIQANGQTYIDSFFGYHNFQRFTSVVNGHDAPIYFYVLVVLLGFAPWSIYLPVAIARLRFWRWQQWQQQPRQAQLSLFALVWFAVIFGFFTVATTKLPSYVLPLMPAAAVLVGLLWSDVLTRPRQPQKALVISAVFNLLLFVAFAVVGLLSPNWMTGDASMPNIGQAVRDSQIMVWSAGLWGGTAIAGLILLLRRQARWLWLVNGIGVMAFIIVIAMPAFFLVDEQRQLPLRQISETIVDTQQSDEPIVMLGFKKPSIVFYTQQPVKYFYPPEQAGQYARRLLRRPEVSSVLIVGEQAKMINTGFSPDQMEVLQTVTPYQLVRVEE
ncbi:MAG: ArnT family glycosyltransferase [Thainema sp.]